MALDRRDWAGWAGEESWPKCDAGAKGQEEKEPQQRQFFSGGWGSQEGRPPGKKRERDRKVRIQLQPGEGRQ